ncbi:uncharacterized protein ARMOST_06644 [Armillaria ostoyae]|uniref:Uncharacterized protein n=1 Tax=Armillaria ostoyae TaxID=47428 RepID=A0A284R3K3_ARMOS|nr:uncharacterized protein ARMOST_06644 [Armillaria ostoyae]
MRYPGTLTPPDRQQEHSGVRLVFTQNLGLVFRSEVCGKRSVGGVPGDDKYAGKTTVTKVDSFAAGISGGRGSSA